MFKRKTKDPSVPFPPTTSKDVKAVPSSELREPAGRKFWRCIYDKEKNIYCGRSCKSWLYIVGYSILYLTFLSTYTLFFLYSSLSLIKYLEKYENIDKIDLMTYSEQGIGLSATPTSVNSQPIISYKSQTDENKYIRELESFFKRRKRSTPDLGPCGSSPFGYWKEPCIIIRINKQLGWSAEPLRNDTHVDIPEDVRNWMNIDEKLWLHCQGFHSYDKEHIGKISYYPYPPGFDPGLYPMNLTDDTPLVAVQITDYTFGISLAVECTLYYDGGSSSVAFLLYVTPKRNVILIV